MERIQDIAAWRLGKSGGVHTWRNFRASVYRDCIAIDVIRACGTFSMPFLFRLSCLRSSTSLDDRFELLLRFFAGSEHI